jgi:hypothetical protein
VRLAGCGALFGFLAMAYEDLTGERSCPWEKEGEIAGCAVRCVSWEALYLEFLGCRVEIPRAEWREKEFESLRRVEAHLD